MQNYYNLPFIFVVWTTRLVASPSPARVFAVNQNSYRLFSVNFLISNAPPNPILVKLFSSIELAICVCGCPPLKSYKKFWLTLYTFFIIPYCDCPLPSRFSIINSIVHNISIWFFWRQPTNHYRFWCARYCFVICRWSRYWKCICNFILI